MKSMEDMQVAGLGDQAICISSLLLIRLPPSHVDWELGAPSSLMIAFQKVTSRS